jgi:hypothetical protein
VWPISKTSVFKEFDSKRYLSWCSVTSKTNATHLRIDCYSTHMISYDWFSNNVLKSNELIFSQYTVDSERCMRTGLALFHPTYSLTHACKNHCSNSSSHRRHLRIRDRSSQESAHFFLLLAASLPPCWRCCISLLPHLNNSWHWQENRVWVVRVIILTH